MRFVLAIGLVIAGLPGCGESMSDPSIPPFRIRPYGPGLEVETEGRKYEFWSGGEMVGKIRVASQTIRVYDGDSRTLGRLARTVGGWQIVRRDGSRPCDVVTTDFGYTIECGNSGTLTLEFAPDRIAIVADGAEWRRFVPDERGGWRSETPGAPEAYGHWSDGSTLAVQTHPDSWRHHEIRPQQWSSIGAIACSLDYPLVPTEDDRLVGAVVGFLAAEDPSSRMATSEEAPDEGLVE